MPLPKIEKKYEKKVYKKRKEKQILQNAHPSCPHSFEVPNKIFQWATSSIEQVLSNK